MNNGTTYEHYDHIPVDNMNFTQKLDNTTNQIIAPFITGRLYSSATSNHWEDDQLDNLGIEHGEVNDPNTNEADDDLEGKYWVNDPSNEYSASVVNTLSNGKGGKYPQLHDKLHGFNDLQRRKDFLCEFLHFGCNGDGGLLAHLAQLQRIPLPPHSH